GCGGGWADGLLSATGRGPTCLTALTLASGVPYAATQLPGVDQWYTFPVIIGGGTFTVTLTAGTDPARFTLVYSGSCASLAFLSAGIGDATIIASTLGAPFTGYAQVSSTPGGTYTIQF